MLLLSIQRAIFMRHHGLRSQTEGTEHSEQNERLETIKFA